MNSYQIAFDYTEITDAEGEIMPADHNAFAQFTADFACAAREVPHLLGYRFSNIFVDEQRANITVIIDGPALDTEALVDLLQVGLYDRGGLPGSFVIGAYRTFSVTYGIKETVVALDADKALRRAAEIAPQVNGKTAKIVNIDPV